MDLDLNLQDKMQSGEPWRLFSALSTHSSRPHLHESPSSGSLGWMQVLPAEALTGGCVSQTAAPLLEGPAGGNPAGGTRWRDPLEGPGPRWPGSTCRWGFGDARCPSAAGFTHRVSSQEPGQCMPLRTAPELLYSHHACAGRPCSEQAWLTWGTQCPTAQTWNSLSASSCLPSCGFGNHPSLPVSNFLHFPDSPFTWVLATFFFFWVPGPPPQAGYCLWFGSQPSYLVIHLFIFVWLTVH